MKIWSRAVDPPSTKQNHACARQFVIGFFAFVLLAIAGVSVALPLLDRAGMLPPPPLTANACIDEKFKFLAENDLGDVDLIAVGSSVTWRNLDMTAFKKAGLAKRPLNAAPCYLHLSETVSYTAFLLKGIPTVRTVVSVMAPRDFDQCAKPREDFFPATLAAAYVFNGMPALPIYLANSKPDKFVRSVLRIKGLRKNEMLMDDYGSSFMRQPRTWLPEPVLADKCFEALTELERVVEEAGATLIVATVPLQPEWQARYDPKGTLINSFEERVRSALTAPSTLFIRGSQSATESLRHGDAVHYIWDSAVKYSALLANEIAAQPLYGRGSR